MKHFFGLRFIVVVVVVMREDGLEELLMRFRLHP
jgi:hypothetical protein